MPSVAWLLPDTERQPQVPQHRHRKEVAFLERNLIDRRTNDFQNAGQLPFPITIRLIHLVMTLIKCIVRNTRRVRSFHTIREPVKKSVENSTLVFVRMRWDGKVEEPSVLCFKCFILIVTYPHTH